MSLIKRWLDNDAKVTLACICISAVALVLSLGGWLDQALPADPAWLAIVLCGVPILVGAAVGLVRDHDVTADVLVSLALLASAGTGELFAAGEVALIMQLGSVLEDYTSEQARRGIEALVEMTPRTARVRRDGEEAMIPVEEVAVGDELVVLVGESVPVDGVLLEGETSVDQSAMTGEAMPVDKAPGDELVSGTVNRRSPVTMRAMATCEDSSLQRMVRLAEEADASKAPIVGQADRWASWMVGVALACALVTWAVTGKFMRAVTVLVVFCPCSFVLATPTAVAAAIGNLTRHGILVRSGEALERLAQAEVVALDKTGTLTCGHPQVTAVRAFADGYGETDVLSLAGTAERRFEHPLGQAILRRCAELGVEPAEGSDHKVLVGAGVAATVEGRRVSVGRPGLLADSAEDDARVDELVAALEAKGATVVLVWADGAPIGLIALADEPREGAADVIARLGDEGIKTMLLTGDNERAAVRVAAEAGIGRVEANLMPEDKMRLVSGDEKVCMVGDGVNDALALRTAYCGVAMGGIGSDVAVESADAVLVEDDLRGLPYLLRVARGAMSKVRQNIVVGMVVNICAIVLSAAGVLTPVTGALWHNCGSVFVVVNAASILRWHDR